VCFYLVALLESVRFSSSLEYRNLTSSSVSCSLKSAQTFSLGARKDTMDGAGGSGGTGLRNGAEMKRRNEKNTTTVDMPTQGLFERGIAATWDRVRCIV
jgi:hypothetical protein